MRYHAVHRTWLRTPPAAGASDAVVGTWVRLTAFAAEAELGEPGTHVTRHRPLSVARLMRARIWSRRAWVAACDTTRPAVDAVVRAGLARWDGDDLLVDGYDGWGEERTRRIRHSEDESGRHAGRDAGEDAAGRPAQSEGDVGRGDVPEGTVAAGGAHPSVDPTPGSPSPRSPAQIGRTPPEVREDPRPELAPAPDDWVGSGVFRRRAARRSP